MIVTLLAEGINVIINNGTNIFKSIKELDKKFNFFLNGALIPSCALTNEEKIKEKKEFEIWQRARFSEALVEYSNYVKV